jgi:predicted SAM-dependent methyltransferase
MKNPLKKQPATDSKSAKALLKAHKGMVKLNVGCGTDYKKSWINIDNNTDNNIEAGKLDLDWDMRNPLPFDDETVDFVFNEHFFEHLTPEEALPVMKDLMRVLKPGGVMRIAMPDLAGVVHNYLHVPIEDDPVIKDFKLDFIKTRAEWMNVSFRAWGHLWLYDWEELERRVHEAGYKKIVRAKLRESKHPELRNLEIRDGSLLIAEITK